MIRSTSIAAYREGNKELCRAKVLAVMQTRDDWTRQEVADALKWGINRVTGRVLELIQMGLVEELGRCRKNAGGRSANLVRVKQQAA